MYKSIFYDSTIDHKEEVIYPNGFQSNNLLTQDKAYQHGKNQEHVTESMFDGIRIEERNVSIRQEVEIEVEHNFPFLKMHFELTGHSIYNANNSDSLSVDIPGGHHQLFFFPKVKGKLNYPANSKRKTLEITLSLDFIKKEFKDNWEILTTLGKALTNQSPLVVGKQSKIINHDIKLVIQQISQCNLKGGLRKIYLKTKVIELLILQIHALNQKEIQLNNTHEDSIRAAKKFMENNLDKNITIDLLAKHVGVNKNQLKLQFKELYGTPIFSYLTILRIEKAIELLTTSNYSISDIANSLSYKYPQHFAKTFKKYTGETPNNYRKQKK